MTMLSETKVVQTTSTIKRGRTPDLRDEATAQMLTQAVITGFASEFALRKIPPEAMRRLVNGAALAGIPVESILSLVGASLRGAEPLQRLRDAIARHQERAWHGLSR